jgi:uncharacterized phage protein (TIGR01671 family)
MFRAWDKKRKEWYNEGNDMALTYKDFHILGECTLIDSPLCQDLQYLEITQFTGLKDKNDKPIYENDIVYVAGVGNMQVTWDVCGYWAFMPDCLDYQDVIEDIERIVGNVYETPDLIPI